MTLKQKKKNRVKTTGRKSHDELKVALFGRRVYGGNTGRGKTMSGGFWDEFSLPPPAFVFQPHRCATRNNQDTVQNEDVRL